MQPRESMNKVNYAKFKQRCLGAEIATVFVSREDRPAHVALKYNARDRRKGIYNGEWIVTRRDRPAEEVERLVAEFLKTCETDFPGMKRGDETPLTKDDAAAKS